MVWRNCPELLENLSSLESEIENHPEESAEMVLLNLVTDLIVQRREAVKTPQ